MWRLGRSKTLNMAPQGGEDGESTCTMADSQHEVRRARTITADISPVVAIELFVLDGRHVSAG